MSEPEWFQHPSVTRPLLSYSMAPQHRIWYYHVNATWTMCCQTEISCRNRTYIASICTAALSTPGALCWSFSGPTNALITISNEPALEGEAWGREKLLWQVPLTAVSKDRHLQSCDHFNKAAFLLLKHSCPLHAAAYPVCSALLFIYKWLTLELPQTMHLLVKEWKQRKRRSLWKAHPKTFRKQWDSQASECSKTMWGNC